MRTFPDSTTLYHLLILLLELGHTMLFEQLQCEHLPNAIVTEGFSTSEFTLASFQFVFGYMKLVIATILVWGLFVSNQFKHSIHASDGNIMKPLMSSDKNMLIFLFCQQ